MFIKKTILYKVKLYKQVYVVMNKNTIGSRAITYLFFYQRLERIKSSKTVSTIKINQKRTKKCLFRLTEFFKNYTSFCELLLCQVNRII